MDSKSNFLTITLLILIWNSYYSESKWSVEFKNDHFKAKQDYFTTSSLCTSYRNTKRVSYKYSKENQQCYQHNRRGPCGVNAKFTMENAENGTCDCDPSIRCGRPLIFSHKDNSCYFAYDQGPCIKGSWMVFNPKTFQGECRRNPCARFNYNLTSGSAYWFYRNGICQLTGTRGDCEDPRDILYVGYEDYEPSCYKSDKVHQCGAGYIYSMLCLPGQKMDTLGLCKRIYTDDVNYDE